MAGSIVMNSGLVVLLGHYPLCNLWKFESDFDTWLTELLRFCLIFLYVHFDDKLGRK